MEETITREINGKMIDIPVVPELPDGIYKPVIDDKRYSVYYSIAECEFVAVRRSKHG